MSILLQFGIGAGRELAVLAAASCLLVGCGSNSETPDGSSTTGSTSSTNGSSTNNSTTGGSTTGSSTTGSSTTGSSTTSTTGAGEPVFTLASPAFASVAECSAENPSVCPVFPDENISYMQSPNNSPELVWTGAPPGTQSFALGLRDLSYGQPLWAIWNIPPDLSGLPANIDKSAAMPAVPAGSQQSNATFAEGDGYFGPESPCNVYQFALYALSTPTFSPSQPEYVAVVLGELEALGGSILGSATLRARTNYAAMCE